MTYTLQEFLALPHERLADIVEDFGKPRTGIFVPNGNRRLTLTRTPYSSNQLDYLNKYVELLRSNCMTILQLLFKHGLRNLIIPLFSSSVLNRKDSFDNVVQQTIALVFGSPEYIDFYNEFRVSINVFGNMELLRDKRFNESYTLISNCIDRTGSYGKARLVFGIGSNDEVGSDLAELGIRFFQQNGRAPTLEEQKAGYYSCNLPEAEFLITSSSLKAHAIPPLICGKHTCFYYLPSPGIIGLNEVTYRTILFDMLFKRSDVDIDFSRLSIPKRVIDNLGVRFENEKNKVIGTGNRIGPFWVIEER